MSKRTETPDTQRDSAENGGLSRRDFLKSSAAGLAAGAAAATGMSAMDILTRQAEAAVMPVCQDNPFIIPNIPAGKKIVLRNGIVLSMDAAVGDFEKADVLIDGKVIVDVRPNIGPVANAYEIDATGMIVMPGMISTHHHQYETLQRSIIPDGLLNQAWPIESYGSVVQNLWTTGRIGNAANPTWDIGRSPYDPEDNYISELVTNLSELTQGLTCGTDTSQASHTPEHTDAMIDGIIASGRRMLYDYSGGTNRDTTPPPLYKVPYGVPTSPYEFGTNAIGNMTTGIGRIAVKYFSSKDQLVTLGYSGGPGNGWAIGRAFSAHLNAHNVGAPATIINAHNSGVNGNDWSDVTQVHCVRWQDANTGQISYDAVSGKSTAWELFALHGGNASIAVIIEPQMRHGMCPFQMALNHGVLPSLSPDVDTNMTPDPFSLMRGAFVIQRGLANDLAFPPPATNGSNPGSLPIPQNVTSRQCIEMMTIAGARASGLLNKVGTLTPGKEADIVMLSAMDNLAIAPMNNVPGTIVTMMDTRAVKHVFVAGKLKVWGGQLVGWNAKMLAKQITDARDRVLARIKGPAVGTNVNIINQGNNSGLSYRPNFLNSCCYNGQNTVAPHTVSNTPK